MRGGTGLILGLRTLYKLNVLYWIEWTGCGRGPF